MRMRIKYKASNQQRRDRPLRNARCSKIAKRKKKVSWTKTLTMSLRHHLQRRRCRKSTMLLCILTKMRRMKMMELLILSNLWHLLLSNYPPSISWVVKQVNLSIMTSRIHSVGLKDNCLQLEDLAVPILNLTGPQAVYLLLAALVACPQEEGCLLRELLKRISMSKTMTTSLNSEVALAAKLRSSRRRSRR
jgi:hypothetical protein